MTAATPTTANLADEVRDATDTLSAISRHGGFKESGRHGHTIGARSESLGQVPPAHPDGGPAFAAASVPWGTDGSAAP